MSFTAWGNYPKIAGRLAQPKTIDEARSLLSNTSSSLIARGNGRSYGDSALQEHMVSIRKMAAIEKFDEKNGIIQVQAGLLLDELLLHIVPKGWFPYVVPGTRMISIGGAIASNVHGKNHHKRGAFGDYVLNLDLLDSDGKIRTCTRDEHGELFQHTIGGMGLTGIILRATIRLKPTETSFYHQETKVASNLSDLIRLFERHKEMPYLVAWIDGQASNKHLGSGLLLMGRACDKKEVRTHQFDTPTAIHKSGTLYIPKLPVSWLMNPVSLWLNNTLYKWKNRPNHADRIVHYSQFFFPLDSLSNWNRLYGPPGLLQYQFVVDFEEAEECIRSILRHLRAAGTTSYLIVLKRMGSNHTAAAATDFPMPGYSLALDFKNTPKTRKLLNELDEIVVRHRGRVYLTKDARLPAETFRQMYPNAVNKGLRFQSLQSERIYDL